MPRVYRNAMADGALFRIAAGWLAGLQSRHFWVEHGVPLLAYAVLSVALSWPTILHFTTTLTSDGGDARAYVWQLWHLKQVVLGRSPLFFAPLVYYPVGASLLTNGAGPFLGMLGLPFWVWGPEAAYNGALLVSYWLSGYCMYLLARNLKFERSLALFAGAVLLVAPIRLAGTSGHLERIFVGLLPIALLCLRHALDPNRRARWAVATAVVMLLTLLHSGYQFIYVVVAVGFFLLAAFVAPGSLDRRFVVRRGLVIVGSSLVLIGPLLLLIMSRVWNPALDVEANGQSVIYQPDLLQFFVPSTDSILFGFFGSQLVRDSTYWGIETPVYVTWTVLVLCVIALIRGGPRARPWLAFSLLIVTLALGPSLKVFGITKFTEYNLPIILPYAFFTELPGLEFMRAPGRFMLVGFVGLAIAATFGLAWLVGRFPRMHTRLIVVPLVLILVETWPKPWPVESLRPTPEFYKEIARDGAMYGVFDLPINTSPNTTYVHESSHHMMYQMTHGKGIASGYISRTYAQHPVFPCLVLSSGRIGDVTVNGQSCAANAQAALAANGYRYLVWHMPQDWYPSYTPGSWSDESARAFIATAFPGQAPIVEDGLVQVYAVSPPANAVWPTTTLALGHGWRDAEAEWRWGTSPATLIVDSPEARYAELDITPALLHDPTSPNGLGERGVLTVQSGDSSTTVELARDRVTTVPIMLSAGSQTITLTLRAGYFRPVDFSDSTDTSLLSFAIRTINLRI